MPGTILGLRYRLYYKALVIRCNIDISWIMMEVTAQSGGGGAKLIGERSFGAYSLWRLQATVHLK